MPDSAAQAPPRAEKQEMKNEASIMLDLPPALEARASDCKTTAEWTSLGTLRMQMADTGTASVAPMSAEFFAAKLITAAAEANKYGEGHGAAQPEPLQGQMETMAAIKVLQDKQVAQLLDRAASGNLTVTEQEYDPKYSPTVMLTLLQEWTKYAGTTAISWGRHKLTLLIKAICTRSRGATGGLWDFLGGMMMNQQSYAGEKWDMSDPTLPVQVRMPYNLVKPSSSSEEKDLHKVTTLLCAWAAMCRRMAAREQAKSLPAVFKTSDLRLLMSDPTTSILADMEAAGYVEEATQIRNWTTYGTACNARSARMLLRSMASAAISCNTRPAATIPWKNQRCAEQAIASRDTSRLGALPRAARI